MPLHLIARATVVCILISLTASGVGLALAEPNKTGASTLMPTYVKECAACHIAYPPGMLPAASWQRIMRNLSQHFGADASLDAESVKQISNWLTNHSTTESDGQAVPEDRITRSTWFRREHAEVPSSVWKRATIKSPSNCAACHTRADQGNFDEHFVRIPQ
ncbi:diheme cytochrome c [Caballeronia glebae]|uniref:diheme cytochrome c n=1 Tax=Caballeronia glebae TaxID=1777143 RepID=UPI0038BB4A29